MSNKELAHEIESLISHGMKLEVAALKVADYIEQNYVKPNALERRMLNTCCGVECVQLSSGTPHCRVCGTHYFTDGTKCPKDKPKAELPEKCRCINDVHYSTLAYSYAYKVNQLIDCVKELQEKIR